LTTNPKLVFSQLCSLDLQNAKELKHGSSSMLPMNCTMEVSTNLKYSRKEQTSNLDVERMRQKCIKGFTSISLAIAAHAFDFTANLSIDCSMLKEDADRTSRTHTLLSGNFLGLQNAALITFKCLLKLSYALDYSQYCGYTTPKLSMTP
jgi:hypothetical protein